MSEEFSELQTLLRLKRHETPPPGYLEDFLAEFHHRQRAELLRRPLWRIALDRLGNMVPSLPALPVPNLAYAGVSAVALVAAAGLLSRHAAHEPVVATLNPVVISAAAQSLPSAAARASTGGTSMAPLAAVRIGPDLDDAPLGGNPFSAFVPPVRSATVSTDRPRYLLDTRPVRYESRSTSF